MGVFPNADGWLALVTVATTVPPLLLLGWQFDAFRDWRWLGLFGLAAVGSSWWLAATFPAFAMTDPAIAAALAIIVVMGYIRWGGF